MRKSKQVVKLFFLLVFFLACCERTDNSLLDPAGAGKWTQYTRTNSGLPGDMVWKIALSADDMWVAFRGQGVGVLSNGDWTFYSSSNSELINNYVNDIQPDKDGNIHFATNNGYCVRTVSGEWWQYRDQTVATMKVKTVMVTSSGNIWLGTTGEGFYVNEGTGFEKVKVTNFENVNSIKQDASGNIWLGTDNGLLRYDGSNFSLLTTQGGLPTNTVTVLYLDNENRLWIGCDGGLAAAWLNNSETTPNYLYLRNGTSGNYIRDIFQDTRGNVWFATWYDGLIRYDGIVAHSFEEYNGFYENDVNCVSADNRGNLWVGLWSKGLVKYMLPLE